MRGPCAVTHAPLAINYRGSGRQYRVIVQPFDMPGQLVDIRLALSERRAPVIPETVYGGFRMGSDLSGSPFSGVQPLPADQGLDQKRLTLGGGYH